MIGMGQTATSTYTQALTRGGALLSEMRALLSAWQPGESAADFRRRAHAEDLLGKATARTVEDYLLAFSRRFLLPSDAAARHLRRILAGSPPRQLFVDLVFYYTTRAEVLLHDFLLLKYWPAVRQGRLEIGNRDVLELIQEAELDGRIRAPWSAEVKYNLPARVLNALSDFGLLRPARKASREVEHYSPTDGALVYLAYLLHTAGVADSFLAQHPAWGLFGLQPTEALNRLDALSGEEWFLVQRAGEVVRVTWQYRSLEEVVDALVG